jgi:hypothetical protein
MPLYLEITSIIKHLFNNDVKTLEKEYLVSISALLKKHGFENETYLQEKK